MASTYLTLSTSTPTDAQKFTWSSWFKVAGLGTTRDIYRNYVDSNNRGYVELETGDTLFFFIKGGGTDQLQWRSSRKFRDINAWYHLVIEADSTQATQSDRFKVYLNGEDISSDFTQTTNPSQNIEWGFAKGSGTAYLGSSNTPDQYYNGVLAHTHFTDGTAYAASTFGETDSTTGIWKPKLSPSVTYGTNGFFLKFENSGSMGTDSSGNDNDFTVNGTMTQTIDTPSNVFCTMNPLSRQSYTFSNGNTTITRAASTFQSTAIATLSASKGKWYWEVKLASGQSSYPRIGAYKNENQDDHVIQEYLGNYNGNTSKWWGSGGSTNKYGTGQTDINTSYASYTNGDILQFAMDLDNGKMWYGKNGTWYTNTTTTTTVSAIGDGTATPAYSDLGTGSFWTPAIFGNAGADVWSANFGNGYFGTTAVSSAQNPDDGIGIFEYDVPAGYRALCTKSINAEEYD